MTDEQLLTLLETKSPEELSASEIELLKERLASSPALQAALASSVQMESYLAAALGRTQISTEAILAKGSQQRALATRRRWVMLLSLVILGVAGAAAWRWAMLSEQPLVAEAPAENKKGDASTTDPKAPAPTTTPAPATQTPASATPATPSVTTGDNPPVTTPSESVPTEAVKPAPPAVDPTLPWAAALAPNVEVPAFEEVAFTPFAFDKEITRRVDLERWFSPVPNEALKIQDGGSSRGQCGVLEGIGLLKAPLLKDSALRLSLEQSNRIQIHCFSGTKGVTFCYYEDQDYRWGAYATEREAGKPRPNKFYLAGTDDGRGRRTELRFGGPLELTHVAGEMRLMRGDITLLSAPLAQLPDEIYFEGRAMIPAISLVRHQPPASVATQRPIVYDNPRPADLSWKANKPEIATAQLRPDGAVRFQTDAAAKEQSFIMTPLPHVGLCEIILELDEITPGSGLFLGREQGVVDAVMRFEKDRRTQQLIGRVHYPDDAHEIDVEPPKDKVFSAVGEHCFVKFLYGCGNLRWWTSPDGIHWGQADVPHDNANGQRTTIGLHLIANRASTGITLRKVSFRELTGLTSLASKELLSQAIAVLDKNTIGPWLAEITRRQPAGTDASDWRRACAIRTLAGGCQRELAYVLLELLLDDARQRKLPLDVQLAALTDAHTLCFDLRDNSAMQQGVPTRMLDLGQQAFDQEGIAPWSAVRFAILNASALTWLNPPLQPEKNLRWELIDEVYRRDRTALQSTAKQARFYHLQPDQNPLLDWVEVVWGGKTRSTNDRNIRMKDGWRHPWVEDLSKESYSLFAEIRASLDSSAWEDAARQITSLSAEGVVGLNPAVGEEDLFTSLPVALRLAIAKHPELKATLGKKFAPLAKLRLAKATAAGDIGAVELATIQFADTEGAGDAHRWLGDRALADGRFSRALSAYTYAEELIPSLGSQLEPRRRLAAAFLGQDLGKPVTQNVLLGEVKLSAAEFEKLVSDLKARGTTALSPLPEIPVPPVPAPTSFQLHKRSRLDGNVGNSPGDEVGRRTNQFQVPWADRQIATAVEGDTLFVSNRFQVASYNLGNGQRTWQSAAPVGAMLKSQDWACIPMRPLLTQDRIFTRQLFGSGPQLVCLSKADGKLLWGTGDRKNEFFASDPVILEGELCILTIAYDERQEGILRWNVLDASTGETRDQWDLLRLRNAWGARACCEVALAKDRLIVATGGVTLAVDVHGKIDWLRRHALVPAEEDPRWILQRFDRPFLADGKVFAFQPGMRCLECLDVATGGLVWRQVLPELTAVEGISQGHLIVRCEEDLRSLQLQDGKLRWKHPASLLLSHLLLDEQRILYGQKQPLPTNPAQQQIRWVWLDPASGNAQASTLLEETTSPDPRQGPLVLHNQSVWTFLGQGQQDPTRDLIQLLPSGTAEKLATPTLANTWLRHVPPAHLKACSKVLPDWRLLASVAADRTGIVSDAYGEKDVLGLKAIGGQPTILGRGLMLPAGSNAKLRIRIASDPGIAWKLETRFADTLVKTTEVTDATFPDRWKTIEIDLAEHAGKTGWLSLEVHHTSGGDGAFTFWKSIELIF